MMDQNRDTPYNGIQEDPAPAHPRQAISATPSDRIIKLTSDEETYLSPWALRGARVQKIEEGGPHWNGNWCSLNKYLDNEPSEIRLKERAQAEHRANPSSQLLFRIAKRHGDNCSKQKKIREIFGPDSSYHPNQVVAPCHLPLSGLCDDQEVMYHMACKISDLMYLSARGELEMDPFNFFRWRLSLALQGRTPLGVGSGSKSVRGAIQKLGAEDGDLVFRQLILRSFHLRNIKCPECDRAFRQKRNIAPVTLSNRDHQVARQEAARAAEVKKDEERLKARRERRAEREAAVRAEQNDEFQGYRPWQGINKERALSAGRTAPST